MLNVRDALANDSSFPGIAVVQGSSGKHMYQPSKEGELIVRVYPVPAEGGGVESFRNSPEPNDFTQWVAVDYVARYVGSEQRITFISRCADQDPRTNEMLWDRFVRIVMKNIDSDHPEWGYLLRGSKGNGAPIPGQTIKQARAKIHAFVQGILVKHKVTSFRNNPKVNAVIMLPPTAKMSLMSMCNKATEGYAGNPANFAEAFECGEWLDPTNGRELIVRFKGGDSTPTNEDGAPTINLGNIGGGGLDPRAAAGGGKTGQMFMNSYDCMLSPHKSPIPAALAHKYWTPWDKVLRYLTSQEQVELMCSAFKPDVVKAVFSGMGLLPRSIEFGTHVNMPTAQPVREQPATGIGAYKPEAVAGVSEAGINFDNIDTSAPQEMDPAQLPFEAEPGSPVKPSAADPAASESRARNMSAALAEARRKAQATQTPA